MLNTLVHNPVDKGSQSGPFIATDVFTFQHGVLAYDMRRMFEAGDLDEDIQRLQGPKATSLFKRNDVCII
tara:strand:+ start:634 stop:843 length:210 start_codon:yes stop_codon:yes gene_type:complete